MSDSAITPRSPANDGAGAFELAQRRAKALAASALVPQVYRGNAANCLIAMEVAERVGASVLMVMQNLHIIHGKPSWSSTFMIAAVNSTGRWTPLKFRLEGTPGKPDWGCRAWAKDKESGEECLGPLVTMAMAKSEGWSDKKGSKWATMPELMLMYRSAAFWSRLYAPEVTMGIHTVEEVTDVHASAGAMRELPQTLAPGNTQDLEAALLDANAVEQQYVEASDDDADADDDPSHDAETEFGHQVDAQ